MRDRLGTAAFINRAPRNRTQTFYARFLKGPGAEIKTPFTESKAAFEGMKKNALKTRYSEYLGG